MGGFFGSFKAGVSLVLKGTRSVMTPQGLARIDNFIARLNQIQADNADPTVEKLINLMQYLRQKNKLYQLIPDRRLNATLVDLLAKVDGGDGTWAPELSSKKVYLATKAFIAFLRDVANSLEQAGASDFALDDLLSESARSDMLTVLSGLGVQGADRAIGRMPRTPAEIKQVLNQYVGDLQGRIDFYEVRHAVISATEPSLISPAAIMQSREEPEWSIYGNQVNQSIFSPSAATESIVSTAIMTSQLPELTSAVANSRAWLQQFIDLFSTLKERVEAQISLYDDQGYEDQSIEAQKVHFLQDRMLSFLGDSMALFTNFDVKLSRVNDESSLDELQKLNHFILICTANVTVLNFTFQLLGEHKRIVEVARGAQGATGAILNEAYGRYMKILTGFKYKDSLSYYVDVQERLRPAVTPESDLESDLGSDLDVNFDQQFLSSVTSLSSVAVEDDAVSVASDADESEDDDALFEDAQQHDWDKETIEDEATIKDKGTIEADGERYFDAYGPDDCPVAPVPSSSLLSSSDQNLGAVGVNVLQAQLQTVQDDLMKYQADRNERYGVRDLLARGIAFISRWIPFVKPFVTEKSKRDAYVTQLKSQIQRYQAATTENQPAAKAVLLACVAQGLRDHTPSDPGVRATYTPLFCILDDLRSLLEDKVTVKAIRAEIDQLSTDLATASANSEANSEANSQVLLAKIDAIKAKIEQKVADIGQTDRAQSPKQIRAVNRMITHSFNTTVKQQPAFRRLAPELQQQYASLGVRPLRGH